MYLELLISPTWFVIWGVLWKIGPKRGRVCTRKMPFFRQPVRIACFVLFVDASVILHEIKKLAELHSQNFSFNELAKLKLQFCLTIELYVVDEEQFGMWSLCHLAVPVTSCNYITKITIWFSYWLFGNSISAESIGSDAKDK